MRRENVDPAPVIHRDIVTEADRLFNGPDFLQIDNANDTHVTGWKSPFLLILITEGGVEATDCAHQRFGKGKKMPTGDYCGWVARTMARMEMSIHRI